MMTVRVVDPHTIGLIDDFLRRPNNTAKQSPLTINKQRAVTSIVYVSQTYYEHLADQSLDVGDRSRQMRFDELPGRRLYRKAVLADAITLQASVRKGRLSRAVVLVDLDRRAGGGRTLCHAHGHVEVNRWRQVVQVGPMSQLVGSAQFRSEVHGLRQQGRPAVQIAC